MDLHLLLFFPRFQTDSYYVRFVIRFSHSSQIWIIQNLPQQPNDSSIHMKYSRIEFIIFCLHNISQFCILICAVTWSGAVWAKSESTTLSSITSTPSNSKSSAKVKRQHRFPYERPPNFSHYVGDAAALDSIRRNADANAQIINQVDQKDSNGNYNYA